MTFFNINFFILLFYNLYIECPKMNVPFTVTFWIYFLSSKVVFGAIWEFYRIYNKSYLSVVTACERIVHIYIMHITSCEGIGYPMSGSINGHGILSPMAYKYGGFSACHLLITVVAILE